MSFVPVILTKNEFLNIEKCIKNLLWCDKILIFDSYSSDKTIPVALRYKNVKIIRCKKNISYVSKINLVLKVLSNKWILLLDADYEVDNKTIKFLKSFKCNDFYSAYSFKIKNILDNKILNTDLYPSKFLLFKTNLVNFSQDGHKEKMTIRGKTKKLNLNIYHYDKKKLNIWFKNQINYSIDEVNKILKISFFQRDLKNKIRSIPFLMNIAIFFYYLFYKNILRFGLSGIKYFFQRQTYELLLAITFIYKSIVNIFYRINSKKKNKL